MYCQIKDYWKVRLFFVIVLIGFIIAGSFYSISNCDLYETSGESYIGVCTDEDGIDL